MMTTNEACDVLIAQIAEVAAARAERDSWRRVARAALAHSHELHLELERMRASHQRLIEEFRALRRGHRQRAA
jgi:hypothetical protein